MNDAQERELRLALGMRGGVSLAVWIGGACSEIDLSRRAARPDATPFWKETLAYSEFDKVVVDVLAGASAGGLNGVLYAASQVYDFPFGDIRRTWLELGGTEDLVRREPPWPSLFAGDGFFLANVHKQLVCLVSRRLRKGMPPLPPPPTIDLRLSATLMEPISRPVGSPSDEQLHEQRSASGFHFRCPTENWLPNDFSPFAMLDGVPDPDFDAAMWRLAVAARATSSYPGAFEAAAVRSSRGPTFGSSPLVGGQAGDCDLGRTFLDRQGEPEGREDAVFTVGDGGILDNIPLGRALDAVAAAPADGPTRRYLVYLQPGAPTAIKPSFDSEAAAPSAASEPRDLESRRSTLAVLRGVMGARVVNETIARDIAQLERHNDEVARAVAVRHATFARLWGRRNLLSTARSLRVLREYGLQRADGDTRLILELLDDPIGTLGEDPFPLQVAMRPIPDDLWRSPLGTWSAAARDELRTELRRAFEGREPGEGLSGILIVGTRPLARLCELLLDWARYLEDCGEKEAGAQKARLYRVMSFVESSLERPRRLAWVATAAGLCAVAPDARRRLLSPNVEQAAALASMTPRGVDQLLHTSHRIAVAVCHGLLEDDPTPLARFRHSALARIDEVVAALWTSIEQRSPPEPEGTDLREAIVDSVLVPIAAKLRDYSLRRPDNPNGHTGWFIDRVMRDQEVNRGALAALEILCYREFATGRPGRRPVDFVRLSSANRTPIAHAFAALLDDAERSKLWWDPTARRAEQQGIHVNLKLAGNELNNFAAFLRAEWRANDWLWGRLDAVPTMVDLLVQPGALRRHLGSDPSNAVGMLRRWVVPAPHPLRDPLLEEVWERHEGAIAQEVDKLLSSTDDPSRLEIPAIRNALISRRQWEILAEELSKPSNPLAGDGSDPDEEPRPLNSAEQTKRKVKSYRIGAETVTEPPRREMADRFTEIADATAETVLWNLGVGRGRASSPPSLGKRLENLLRRGTKWGARLAIARLVGPAGGNEAKGKHKALVPLAFMAAAALFIAGLIVDKWAFGIGLTLGLLPVVPFSAFVYLRLKKWLATEPPPVTPPPEWGVSRRAGLSSEQAPDHR